MHLFTVFLYFLSLFEPLYSQNSENAEREITIQNKCSFATWVGIQGPGNPANGGFKLDSEERRTIYVDPLWTGTIWPRTECDEEMNCATGECGPREECNGSPGSPPFTVAEFSLNMDGFNDTYSVSMLNGYNIPILIEPFGPLECQRAGGCDSNPNDKCPMEFAIQKDQVTVGCKTGCLVYNNHRECCRGIFASEVACSSTIAAQIFKESCPTAISHEFDESNTFTCNGASYVVQFC
uniref:Thaumatin-like protein n=1 Tax=Caenorhabditis tropicalis TaxID=1561998 RepID=A0A1I7SZK4_9PELO